jgi:hypothetical protein
VVKSKGERYFILTTFREKERLHGVGSEYLYIAALLMTVHAFLSFHMKMKVWSDEVMNSDILYSIEHPIRSQISS